MKKLAIWLAAVALVIGPTTMTFAAPQLNWGIQVNPGQCDVQGALVINITHQVIRDLDDGEAGNYWARDDYNKHIQVWKIGSNPDRYCVDVRYLGSFVTLEARSPGTPLITPPVSMELTREDIGPLL